MKGKWRMAVVVTIVVGIAAGAAYVTQQAMTGQWSISRMVTPSTMEERTTPMPQTNPSTEPAPNDGTTSFPHKPIPIQEDITVTSKGEAIRQARQAFREYRFQEGSRILGKWVSSKEMMGEEEAARLLRDASLMESMQFQHEGHDEHGGTPVMLIPYFSDPEMLLLAVLSLSKDERESVIQNKDSLNPIFEGMPVIQTSNEIPLSDDAQWSVLHATSKQAWRISFTVERYLLTARFLQKEDGTWLLYDMQSEQPTPFKTINQWQRLNKQFRS